MFRHSPLSPNTQPPRPVASAVGPLSLGLLRMKLEKRTMVPNLAPVASESTNPPLAGSW